LPPPVVSFHWRCIRALAAAKVAFDLGRGSKADACEHDDECRPFCALPRYRARQLEKLTVPTGAFQIDDHCTQIRLPGVIKDDHGD
jgi:hypothetical protein